MDVSEEREVIQSSNYVKGFSHPIVTRIVIVGSKGQWLISLERRTHKAEKQNTLTPDHPSRSLRQYDSLMIIIML